MPADARTSRPRRIGHVLRWPTVAGTEIATLRLAQALPTEEFTHLAFVAHCPSATSTLFSRAGWEVVPYPPVEMSLKRPFPFLGASLRLARAFRRSRVEVIHCSDLLATFDATLAACFARLPVICHVRNPHDPLARRYRTLLRLVDRFIFVSGDTRRHCGFSALDRRSSIIYDGLPRVDLARDDARRTIEREFGMSPSAKVIAMAARLAPQKDHATLVRAALQVVKVVPDAHFLIVGDISGDPVSKSSFELINRLIGDLGLNAHFTFTGFRTDIPTILAGVDVAVLVTHYEGFPLAVLEAASYATPVVASAVGGIPEFVHHENTGLLHRHEDPSDLAVQLLSLLTDPAKARRLGEAGRQRVRDSFTVEHLAVQIRDVYRCLAP